MQGVEEERIATRKVVKFAEQVEQRDEYGELETVRIMDREVDRPKAKARRTQSRVIREDKLGGLNADGYVEQKQQPVAEETQKGRMPQDFPETSATLRTEEQRSASYAGEEHDPRISDAVRLERIKRNMEGGNASKVVQAWRQYLEECYYLGKWWEGEAVDAFNCLLYTSDAADE